MLRQTARLLAVCALLVAAAAAWEAEPATLRGSRSLLQDTGLLCSAERDCVEQACTAAYADNAADFPYTLDYTTSGDENATTFVFNLCSESCEQGADFCHPLSTFQLRLNDQLVSDKRYIQRLATGSLVQSCAPRGPGVNFNRTELASLGRNNPANNPTCEQFSMSVFHPPGDQQLKLSDICQQGIEIVNRQGETLTEQPGDSCAYILQLSDKSSGIAFLKQKVGATEVSPSPAASPSPSPEPSPSPSPSPRPSPSPSPRPSPSPSPRPSPSPSPRPSPSPSPRPSPSPSPRPSPSPSPRPSPSPSPRPSPSPSPRPSPSPAGTLNATTFSPAPFPSPRDCGQDTLGATIGCSPEASPSPAAPRSPAVSPSPAASPSPRPSPSPAASPVPSPQLPSPSPAPRSPPLPPVSPPASPPVYGYYSPKPVPPTYYSPKPYGPYAAGQGEEGAASPPPSPRYGGGRRLFG